MRCLLPATELSFRRAATHTKVEVVIVRVSPGGLMQNPSRAKDGFGRRLGAGGVAEKSRLELVRTEEPLHSSLLVHEQAAHEVPVASFVEPMGAPRRGRQPEAIEAHPAVVPNWHASAISDVEQKVDIAAGAMTAVAGMLTTVTTRKVSDAKRVAARKSAYDCTGSTLDRRNERGRPVTRSISRTQALVPLPAVGERQRVTEVAVVRRADRDRLAGLHGLADAGGDRSDHHDCESSEKPNHSNCMIAHGSA